MELTTTSAKTTTFVFKGMTFVVMLRRIDNVIIYRDKAHFGGPWTNAIDTIDNKSVDLRFRKLLRVAISLLKGQS